MSVAIEKTARKYLSETEVSDMTGIPRRTLQQWRLQRRLLPYHKIGACVRYAIVDVEAYIAAHAVAVDAE